MTIHSLTNTLFQGYHIICLPPKLDCLKAVRRQNLKDLGSKQNGNHRYSVFVKQCIMIQAR